MACWSGVGCRSSKMKILRLQKILLCLLLCFSCDVFGLKCRTTTDSQQNSDFEYVVRMCLRRLRNESDIYDLYRIQSNFNSNKRHRNDMQGDNNNNNNDSNNNRNHNNNNNNNSNDDDDDSNRNYFNRNRGYPEGFDRFWPPSSVTHDRSRYGDEDRYRQEGDYMESDYFGGSRNGKEGRKKFKGRSQTPHSYQQQLQHDREMYNRGNRDSKGYFYSNRNKNTKLVFNKDRNKDSPLADIDPCVIHCIFQEMQMVDDNGKPNKGMISQKMTQKIWNSELKNFIQESIDDCFEAIDEYSNNNNRYRDSNEMCDWAKTFAICLEDKGRENCDDWNEPIQKNHNNNKSSEDQRRKSKQNDRG